MAKIKAVIFDQDGVILDSEPLNKKSVFAILRKYGVKTTKGDREYKGISIRKIFENEFKDSELIDKIEGLLEERRNIYKELAEKEIRVFEGFFELIDLLKGKYKLAVVTSASRMMLDFNKRVILKRDNLFDVEITDKDAKNIKPHPDPYLVAAEKLKLKPEECVVIEDSINGIISAKKAGMKVIAITNSFKKEQLEEEHPDIIIESLKEINLEMIKNLEK